LVPLETVFQIATRYEMDAGVAQRLDAQRQVAALATALSGLEMEVLQLHFVEEFSLREIGRVVGRSERAVDSLLRRAKQKARERLAEDAR